MLKNVFPTVLIVLLMSACEMQDGRPSGGGEAGSKTESELALPAIISDNMVLLQESDANIWGKAVPYSKITVKVSWSQEKAETTADADGDWCAKVRTPKASSQPHIIDITDSQKGWKRIRNILVGEVWMCSGQSNMEMPMRGFGTPGTSNYQPVKDADKELADADYPEFRYFKVPYADLKAASKGKVFDVREGCKWVVCTQADAKEYSAIAFFFGRKLHEDMKVPVGMIGCSYGGTPIAAWMPDMQMPVSEEKSAPGILYNGMVWPVHNYTMRGILWYQGESDTKNSRYDRDLTEMVSKWRRDMTKTAEELPFYFAQISAWGNAQAYDDTDKALTRERQFNAMAQIPNSGVVCTADVGDNGAAIANNGIHFPNKKVPAERFYMWAAKNQYGRNIDPQGPTYEKMEISGDRIIISFSHATSLSCSTDKIPYVRIAGDDKVFHDAEAVLGPGENQITVSSSTVREPKAVRYCFTTWHVSTVYNENGLPVYPFRTDLW